LTLLFEVAPARFKDAVRPYAERFVDESVWVFKLIRVKKFARSTFSVAVKRVD
jgi:hypothetical protein